MGLAQCDGFGSLMMSGSGLNQARVRIRLPFVSCRGLTRERMTHGLAERRHALLTRRQVIALYRCICRACSA